MALANLTVAIATLDRPQGLRRCLDALLSGDSVPAEVIIVDQSQDDATQSIVAGHQSNGVRIIYIRQQRRGLAASRNAATARASYPIIAMTDDDCVPDGRWIAATQRTFASIPVPDAVTGRVLPLGPHEPGTYAISTRDSIVRADFTGRVLPWIVGSGGNFAVKRDLLNRIGGYDERLGAGSPGKAAEDMDMFYRLLRAEARVRFEPEAVVYHERQGEARHLASRWSYGYGMGAFCGIWLRQSDIYAARILGSWMLYHCTGLATAIRHRQWRQVHQRLLSVRGMMCGLLYGLRARQTA